MIWILLMGRKPRLTQLHSLVQMICRWKISFRMIIILLLVVVKVQALLLRLARDPSLAVSLLMIFYVKRQRRMLSHGPNVLTPLNSLTSPLPLLLLLAEKKQLNVFLTFVLALKEVPLPLGFLVLRSYLFWKFLLTLLGSLRKR